MSHQESRGKRNELKGRLKEAAGIVTGNSKLERVGSRERAKGAVQKTIGKAHRKAGEALGGLADTIKK